MSSIANDTITLPPGLWKQSITQFDTLALQGKLMHGPYLTEIHNEDGFKFAFQLAPHLNNKPVLPADAPERTTNNVKSNPFANPDPDFLLGGRVGPAHFLMLNKFCVYRPSLLLITSSYAPQSRALDARDVSAAWAALSRLSREAEEGEDDEEGVKLMVIYNCGAEAGSSQGHKHLQILPHPRTAEGRGGELFELFPSKALARAGGGDIVEDGQGAMHKHFILPLSRDADAESVVRVHERLLQRMREFVVGFDGSGGGGHPSVDPPHNVVMTREWMCLIPRRRSGIDRGTPANALGMVGVVWTTREGEGDWWLRQSGSVREHLKHLGYPV